MNVVEFSAGSETSEEGLKKRPKFLVAGIGKEHRLGRWFQDFKEAKNGIVIVPLKPKSSSSHLSTTPSLSNENESKPGGHVNNNNNTNSHKFSADDESE